MKINGNTVGTPTPRSNYNQTDPKKADYIVGREKIVTKDELEGGAMAFRILAVSGNTITLDSTEGLELGYHCSADCGNNYNDFGYITAINGNTITVDTALTNYTIEEDSVLWIPGHPELGTTKIGEGAYNFGINCKANQKGAFTTGEDNISDGKRSFTANRGNYAGYLGATFGSYNNVFAFNGLAGGNYNTLYFEAINALLAGYMNQFKAPNGLGNGCFNWGIGKNILVTGEYNTAGADNDLVGGEHSQSYYERCLLFGLYLLSGRKGQTIFGDYNAPNARDIFQIGVGTDENHRANAFIVDKNRNTIGGTNNNILDIINKFNILLYGEGLWAQNNGESSLGRYNISTPQTVFTVGIGTADNARKNGLAVEKDGRVVIGADPVYSMDVATKQYVDNKVGSGSGGGTTIEHTTLPMTEAVNGGEVGTWHIYHDTANDTYEIYGYADIEETIAANSELGGITVYGMTVPLSPLSGYADIFRRKHHATVKHNFGYDRGNMYCENFRTELSSYVCVLKWQALGIADEGCKAKGTLSLHIHVEAE